MGTAVWLWAFVLVFAMNGETSYHHFSFLDEADCRSKITNIVEYVQFEIVEDGDLEVIDCHTVMIHKNIEGVGKNATTNTF